MYEWQHRGSTDIHGFLWLKGALDISNIEWNNVQLVQSAINYLDNYVSRWNHQSNPLQNH